MGSIIKPKGLAKTQLIQANIGEDYWEIDFSSYEGPTKPMWLSKKYLTNLDNMKENGVGILYAGPNGPGKTALAMIVFKYLARARWDVYVTSLGDLIEAIQSSWKGGDDDDEVSEKERCRQCSFLLIDDVGKEHRGQTAFVQTVFDNLIRYRIQHRLPTFLTTNYTKSELENAYGESVMSLLDGKLLPIAVDGEDHRVIKQKKDVRNGFK